MALWPTIRRIWITTGLVATAIFVAWSLIAFRASGPARAALQDDPSVRVEREDTRWSFLPAQRRSDVGLLFFPGGLVDPAAYAPLLRGVADAGHVAVLVPLPRRGAFRGADDAEVLNRAVSAMSNAPGMTRWVVAGHSKGGAVASRFALTGAGALGGLVLIGTSHPRDFSLAQSRIPVTRIYGTRDTVADVEKLERTRRNLPPEITDVRIDGGNHSQFGYYGFQPGDWPATISREEQQRITLDAVLDALRRASSRAS